MMRENREQQETFAWRKMETSSRSSHLNVDENAILIYCFQFIDDDGETVPYINSPCKQNAPIFALQWHYQGKTK